jgi:hypothetical protein
MLNPLFLAQFAPNAASDVATSNAAISDLVGRRFDDAWQQLLDGGLFSAISGAMLGVALLFLVITSTLILIEWIKTNDDKQFFKLITPIFVVMFLLNGGALTKIMVTGIRDVGNGVNKIILVKLNYENKINKQFSGLTGEQTFLTDLKTDINRCNSDPNITTQRDCLNKIKTKIDFGIQTGQIRNASAVDKLQRWSTDLASKIATADSTGAAFQIGDALLAPSNALLKLVLSPFESALFFILMIITSGVQVAAEGSMMLTSLIAPIYVTGALLPQGMKSIITLLTQFWSIINWKICYTIMVGLSSQMLSDDSTNSILLAFITGILAPILAIILAKGGGMGFYNAATSAAGKALDLGGQALAGAATGGTSTVAMSIGKSVASKMGK